MIKKKISTIAAALLVSSSLMAAYVPAGPWIATGHIENTPHDLSAVTGMDSDGKTNGEICVFCHTPHASNTAFTGAPLWNKAGPTAPVYTLYGAVDGAGDALTDTQGETIAGTKVGDANGSLSSPSLACLSCHDGVSAIDSVLNAPGSGMNTVAGTIQMGELATTSIGRLLGGNIGGGAGGTGVDMSNDHPVSVIYGGDDANPPASLKGTGASITGWVGAGATGTIADILRNGRVECSSCHDPHNGYASPAQQGVLTTAPQVNYLRMTNAGSALCLGCHDK